MTAALVAILRKAHTTSLRKRCKLLGLLLSITQDVAGSRGMFTQVQHELKRSAGRHVQLTTDVHDDLKAWRKLVRSLASRPAHLRKLEPFPPTWIGTNNASGSGMGGVCQYLEGQYFVWRYPFSLITQAHLVSSSNPTVDVTIKYLNIGALLMQLLLFTPRMAPLAHIHTYVDDTAAQG